MTGERGSLVQKSHSNWCYTLYSMKIHFQSSNKIAWTLGTTEYEETPEPTGREWHVLAWLVEETGPHPTVWTPRPSGGPLSFMSYCPSPIPNSRPAAGRRPFLYLLATTVGTSGSMLFSYPCYEERRDGRVKNVYFDFAQLDKWLNDND